MRTSSTNHIGSVLPSPAVQSAVVERTARDERVYQSAVSPPALDRGLLDRIDRANEAVESGGRGAIASRLVTSAGPGNPASYGRSQLLVELQVDGLLDHARTPQRVAELERLGVGIDDLRGIERRGEAAARWYDAIVRRRTPEDAPLDRAAVDEVRRLTAAGELEAVVARHGAAFEAQTGIPARELGFLALTSRLLDPAVSSEYRRLATRRGTVPALDRLVERHPELGALRERMGSDASLAFFLRRPKRNGEHRAAWYTRAARVDEGQYDRLIAALNAGGDRITSRARSRRNLATATRLLDALPDAAGLAPARRDRLLAQLARVQHGNPSYFVERFGTPSAPRVRSVAELERTIQQMLSAPAHTSDGDQGRSIRAFTRQLTRATPAPIGVVRTLPA